MNALFFYGTLRHLTLLEAVLGRPAEGLGFDADSLPGFALRDARDGGYPVLVPEDGASCDGIRINGLSDQDVERLDYYEGAFEYRRENKVLRSGFEVPVYIPSAAVAHSDDPWSFTDWRAEYAAVQEVAAVEFMSYAGRLAPTEAARHVPRMRARAQSYLNAQSGTHGAGTLKGRVQIEKRDRQILDFYAFDDIRLQHETFDGGMSDTLRRGVFVPSDAAAVLPYDPVSDRVLLVEQMRVGPLARGDKNVWQLEPIAGLIDPGETPEETATREALEEAGLTLDALEPITQAYTSPGGSADFMYLYLGLCTLDPADAGQGGLASEGEDIRAHVLTFDALVEMAGGGALANMPLLLGVYWLAAHRDRLRSAAVRGTAG
jgi:nudix-type nucleoside diphosphatase (YffH/AdpP family)